MVGKGDQFREYVEKRVQLGGRFCCKGKKILTKNWGGKRAGRLLEST